MQTKGKDGILHSITVRKGGEIYFFKHNGDTIEEVLRVEEVKITFKNQILPPDGAVPTPHPNIGNIHRFRAKQLDDSYQAWDNNEDDSLLSSLLSFCIDQGKKHGRTPGAISARIKKLSEKGRY